MATYDELAEEQARRLRPDLDPGASKGQARTFRSLVRILSVASECNDLRRGGVRNAVSVIASRRGSTESTVKMLLHRAQDHGIPLVPQPSARSTLRARYADAIRKHLPDMAEELADELMAIRDTEIENLRTPASICNHLNQPHEEG